MKKKFEIFLAMAEFYEKRFSQTAIDLFFRTLSDMDDDQFVFACSEHMRRSKWFPKPSELLEIVSGTKQKRAEIEAVQAWQTVLYKLKYFGADNLTGVESKAWAALNQVGGTDRLRIAKESELPWIQRDFIARYQDIVIYPVLADMSEKVKMLSNLKSMP